MFYLDFGSNLQLISIKIRKNFKLMAKKHEHLIYKSKLLIKNIFYIKINQQLRKFHKHDIQHFLL